jgi:hypothetical protein
LVAERDGEIVQFMVLERLVEMRMGGSDVEALQELIKEAPAILAATKQSGIRYLHCCVPIELADSIGRHLKEADIHRSANNLFVADLRDEADDAH